jgi:prophage tail gpP-like protein
VLVTLTDGITVEVAETVRLVVCVALMVVTVLGTSVLDGTLVGTSVDDCVAVDTLVGTRVTDLLPSALVVVLGLDVCVDVITCVELAV